MVYEAKKSTKDFLIKLEKNTSITFDWSNLEPTDKYVQANNQIVESDTLTINEGKLIMMISSCGCNSCKEIFSFQIFYGLGNSTLRDAGNVKNQIKKIAPTIPVELFNLLDLNSILK